MAKFTLFFVMLFSFSVVSAQKAAPCCMSSSTDKFAMLASNGDFMDLHKSPLPYTGPEQEGHEIEFPSTDGQKAYGWEVISPHRSNFYLFVFHEWWGLNDYIKNECERLSNELKINVIAIDLYDKKTTDSPEEASKLVQSVKTPRAVAIIRGAYNYVGKSAQVFTLGWCFGGGWSLQAAIEGGQQAKGCVMYYGMPEEDVNRLKKLDCDVIGFFGNKDQGITPAMVDRFVNDMQEAGKKLYVYRYDAVHAFANPSNPNFDRTATADAHDKMVKFIEKRMEIE